MPTVGRPDPEGASTRPIEVVAYLISPIHLIAALGAARALHVGRPIRMTVWVHWPYAEASQVEELLAVVKAMARKMPDVVSVQGITTADLVSVMGRADADVAAAELRKKLGSEKFEEIYYPHDVVGEFFWALGQAYPRARRICFGDGLGIVYERRYYMDISYPRVDENGEPIPPLAEREPIDESRATTLEAEDAPTDLLTRLWMRLTGKKSRDSSNSVGCGRSLVPFATRAPKPHIAALILPVDHSGSFLRRVELQIVPKKVAVDLVALAADGSDEFRTHVKDILQRCARRLKFLLITENNAEGECISFEREIEMYCSIVRQLAPVGSAVVLKSHPGETLPRNEAITAALTPDYEVFTIDSRFKRYPIELATELVRECRPICMSYPTLSLRYLYGIDVWQPMDAAFIEKWFPKRFWLSFKDSLLLYDEPLKRLSNWDGTTVLWRGK